MSERVQMYQIDVVVSIEKGGWFVGEVIARTLQVPHLQIAIGSASGDGSKKSQDWNLARSLIRMSSLQDYLSTEQELRLTKELDDPDVVNGKNVLLVDDFIHSGRTIGVARDYLYGLWSGPVYVAALANAKGLRFPAFCMLHGNYRYPWSLFSNEYEIFQDMYRRDHFGRR
ncbi:MAG: phosphoribosyltransferase [Candidatus Pacebacteria bacterium]|nr:phosphoribosyltransferase [Candidatus Paceibacterota bacterium]